MFQRILVPLDGSVGAERAIPVAARTARASGGSIVFMRVILPPAEVGLYGAEPVMVTQSDAFARKIAAAANYLTKMTSAYADDLAGIATERDVAVAADATAPTIFSGARVEQVDLIVMCSHGARGLKRWIFGSIAHEAVRQSPVPVLILHERGVGPRVPDAVHPLRTLVTLDGSTRAEAALHPAAHLTAALAVPDQGALHLLGVVNIPSANGRMRSQAHGDASVQEQARKEAETYLQMVAHRFQAGPLAALQLTVTTSVAVSTDVAGTILKQAEQGEDAEGFGGCDVIAMATHGRNGLRRLLMGSVTERMDELTLKLLLPLLVFFYRVTGGRIAGSRRGEKRRDDA